MDNGSDIPLILDIELDVCYNDISILFVIISLITF